MTDRIGYLALLVATCVVYGTMLFGTLPAITEGFGGQLIPDLRLSGYTFEDIQAFLAAATPEGVAAISGTHLYLDAIFPALLALCLALPMNGLLKDRRVALRIVGVLLPMAAAVYDYLENVLIARIVALGLDGVTPELVAFASQATELKAILNGISVALIIVLIGIRSWENRKGAGA